MKVKPKRLTEQTHEYIPDEKNPDDKVVYTIIPLSTQMQMHIGSMNIIDSDDERVPDGGGATYDTVGYGLKSISGLQDIDDSGHLIPFELEFNNRKIGKHTHKRITDACLDRIPSALFLDILEKINMAASITVEEIANINFTPDSSPPILTGVITANEKSETMETIPDALTSEPLNSVEE